MADRAACAPPRAGDHDDARGVHGGPARLLSQPRPCKPEVPRDVPTPPSTTNTPPQRAEPHSATQRCTTRGPLSRGPLGNARARVATTQECIRVPCTHGTGSSAANVFQACRRNEPPDLRPVAPPATQGEEDVPDLWSCSSDEPTPPASPSRPEDNRQATPSRHFHTYNTIDDTITFYDVCLDRGAALRSLSAPSAEAKETARNADAFTTLSDEQALRISNH